MPIHEDWLGRFCSPHSWNTIQPLKETGWTSLHSHWQCLRMLFLCKLGYFQIFTILANLIGKKRASDCLYLYCSMRKVELFPTDVVHFQFFFWGFPLYPASAHSLLGFKSSPRIWTFSKSKYPILWNPSPSLAFVLTLFMLFFHLEI